MRLRAFWRLDFVELEQGCRQAAIEVSENGICFIQPFRSGDVQLLHGGHVCRGIVFVKDVIFESVLQTREILVQISDVRRGRGVSVCIVEIVPHPVEVLNDGVPDDQLRATFHGKQDGDVKREMQQGPDLLAYGPESVMFDLIKVEDPDEILERRSTMSETGEERNPQ